MVAIALGSFSPPFAAGSIAIALPVIARSLDLDMSAAQWIVGMYLLTTTAFMVSAGRLGDVFGLRNVYLTGLGVFALGGVVSALSTQLGVMLFGRFLQGVGGSMIIALTAAIPTRAFPAAQRGSAHGLNSIFVYAGMLAGPVVGGWVAGGGSWQLVFLATALPAVLGLVMAFVLLAEFAPLAPVVRGHFDVAGAVLMAAVLTAALTVLGQGATWGWTSAAVIVLLAAGVVAGILLARRNGRAPNPIVELRMFRDRLFAAGMAANTAAHTSLYIISIVVPFYLVERFEIPVERAGLLLALLPLTMVFAAPLSGWASDRMDDRIPRAAGLALLTAGLTGLTGLSAGDGLGLTMTIALLCAGAAGVGAFVSVNNATVMGAVREMQVGGAAGVLATTRNLGMACGTSLGALLLTSGSSEAGQDALAVGSGFQLAFGGAAGLAFGALVGVLLGGLTEEPSGGARQQGPAGREQLRQHTR